VPPRALALVMDMVPPLWFHVSDTVISQPERPKRSQRSIQDEGVNNAEQQQRYINIEQTNTTLYPLGYLLSAFGLWHCHRKSRALFRRT